MENMDKAAKREQVMAILRDDISYLTESDREEIFLTILKGSSDITQELLQKLCNEYETGVNVALL